VHNVDLYSQAYLVLLLISWTAPTISIVAAIALLARVPPAYVLLAYVLGMAVHRLR
jgi:hypothetical protein